MKIPQHLTLIQIGNKFYKLVLECEIKRDNNQFKTLDKILDNNKVLFLSEDSQKKIKEIKLKW